MSQAPEELRPSESLDDVLERAGASAQARALLQPQLGARDFAELLVSQKLYPDAIALLVQLLPRREAVWWAWSCACEVAGETPRPAVAGVLEAVRQWILEPTDTNRRATFDAAEAVEFETSAGFVGLAVFLSGDKLGPADGPPSPPGPIAAPRALAASICVAAFEPGADAADRFGKFIARGMDCAAEAGVWESP